MDREVLASQAQVAPELGISIALRRSVALGSWVMEGWEEGSHGPGAHTQPRIPGHGQAPKGGRTVGWHSQGRDAPPNGW